MDSHRQEKYRNDQGRECLALVARSCFWIPNLYAGLHSVRADQKIVAAPFLVCKGTTLLFLLRNYFVSHPGTACISTMDLFPMFTNLNTHLRRSKTTANAVLPPLIVKTHQTICSAILPSQPINENQKSSQTNLS